MKIQEEDINPGGSFHRQKHCVAPKRKQLTLKNLSVWNLGLEYTICALGSHSSLEREGEPPVPVMSPKATELIPDRGSM